MGGSLVGQIDRGIGLFGKVICEESCICEFPSKNVMNIKNSCGFGLSSDINFVVSERGLFANRSAVPAESRLAGFTRHDDWVPLGQWA